jgi:hypothetical protein
MGNATFIDRAIHLLSSHPKEVGGLAVLIGITIFYFINRGVLTAMSIVIYTDGLSCAEKGPRSHRMEIIQTHIEGSPIP